jgi:hypothetical protein
MYKLTEEERQLIVDCIAFTITADAIIKDENYISEDGGLNLIEKLKTGRLSEKVSIYLPFKKEEDETLEDLHHELENPRVSLKLLNDNILPRSN